MSTTDSLELNTILAQVEKYCAFSLGKELVHNTVPSYDRLVIRRDHAYMKEALEAVIKYDTMPFHGISDIRLMLQNAAKGRLLSAQDFLKEMRFIQGIRDIRTYEKSLEEVRHDSLKDLTDTLVAHEVTYRVLAKCFDEYGEVRDSASPDLKAVRSELRNADAAIAAAANRFLATHADSVVDGIITYRAGRAVVLVKASDKNTFGGMVYGDSASGQTTYIEPPSFVAANNHKQALMEKEDEEIKKILRMCSDEVQKIAAEEEANLDTCAILDAVFAKAQWGKDREACAAYLADDKELYIERGRHPLIDAKKVVSNTYHITPDKKILLITGPNTGGKTVSMKIIGLFVLMTYAGMPVTADQARIPFFDEVFVDIGDDQSVESSLSSFSAHMTKQADVCRRATRESLVLLDEVGSGTDPREGEALAIAILNDLREKKTIAVVTTHYDRLKAYGKRHDDILVASVQFDMEKLAPTYRYIEGLTGQSNAFEVAERYGLPDSIISYARYLKNQAKTQEDRLIERLEEQLNEATLKQDELEKKIAENDALAKKLAKEKAALEKERETFRIKAKKEADDYIESVRKEADQVLKDIRKRQENAKYHEALDAVQGLNQLNYEEEKEEDKLPENFEYHVGDAVELKGNTQVCEIIAIKKKDITILMNGREVHVKKHQIRPSMHIIPKMKKQSHVSINTGRDIFASMPQEVNLIGLHVDEALEKMADYMDSASLHGLKNFRIIHGDGTGRLRKAVHNKLKNDSGVKEFRLGMPQEGGTGATVVIMK